MSKKMTFSRRAFVGAAAAVPMITVGGAASVKALKGDSSYKFIEQVLKDSYGSICCPMIVQKFYTALQQEGTILGPVDQLINDVDQHWTFKRVIVEEFSLRTNILEVNYGTASTLEMISS